jgi:hypothetical protein
MPHYEILLDNSGAVTSVERDGKSVKHDVQLEQLYSVSTFYFNSAIENIKRLEQKENIAFSETLGVQSFLMSLTGLEAFINTYFLLRAQEKSSEQLSASVNSKSGKLHERLTSFVQMAGDEPLQDKQRITDRLSKLSAFRHALVHPRWEPASLTMTGAAPIVINGLVENARSPATDPLFCREAFWWCVYAVALVGQSRGGTQLDGFIFHWTGQFGVSLSRIKAKLGMEKG